MSGSATASGTSFQENLAAWFACLVLADAKLPPFAGLPSTTRLDAVHAETPQPVDDLNIRTSDGGQIFVQAKAGTLACSTRDKRFVSAIGQFVRQFSVGYSSPVNPHRNLDDSKDRMILAVSSDASRAITTDLPAVLGALRSSCDSITFKSARDCLSAPRQRRLEILEEIIAIQCSELKIAKFSQDHLQHLLRLIHIVPFDFHCNGHSYIGAHSLLKQAILCDPSRADQAWHLLIATVRNFAPSRTGGDRAFFRSALQSHSLIPKPVVSSEAAIESLRTCSTGFERHIEPFSEIQFKAQKIHIQRPVVSHLVSTASDGDVVVTGSAGAGKSGCLQEFVRTVRGAGADVLLLAVDQLAATTFRELDFEIGLPPDRDLVQLLADWSGPKDAYLVIDALDAARTGHGLNWLCTRIEQLRRHAPRWRVVASIREFDLRHSHDIRRLFAGGTGGLYTKKEFNGLRHVYVDRLTDDELADFGRRAPEVARVRESTSPELRELTRNPFNLRLLTELVEREVTDAQLTHIRTQVELLNLYWNERVKRIDSDGSLKAGLSRCVRRMVDARSLQLSESSLLDSEPNAHEWLARLASAAVLNVSIPAVPDADRTISFVHNILYDYGVARLLLKDLPPVMVEWLGAKERQDLLLAIRPSIVLAFQRLWHSHHDRKLFWQAALRFVTHPSIRLIGKIIAADVAALEFRRVADIAPLLEHLTTSERESATTLLQFTLQAAIAHFNQDAHRFPLWGPSAPEWLSLAALLAERFPAAALWQVRSILAHLTSRN
jgi:hypothetical protein